MSPSTVRRATEATGAPRRQLELAFSATVQATGTVPDPPLAVPLQLSLDGSLVHLREEGWREVKLLAVGERSPTGEALTALSYAATLGSAAVFGNAAVGELGRRGVPQATDLVAVNDGAVWIQELRDLHPPRRSGCWTSRMPPSIWPTPPRQPGPTRRRSPPGSRPNATSC